MSIDPAAAPTTPRGGGRLVAGFRRRRGPIVRYWTAEFEYLGADPVEVEAWSTWARRQARGALEAVIRLRWFAI